MADENYEGDLIDIEDEEEEEEQVNCIYINKYII